VSGWLLYCYILLEWLLASERDNCFVEDGRRKKVVKIIDEACDLDILSWSRA
jgi:hypothetical protein